MWSTYSRKYSFSQQTIWPTLTMMMISLVCLSNCCVIMTCTHARACSREFLSETRTNDERVPNNCIRESGPLTYRRGCLWQKGVRTWLCMPHVVCVVEKLWETIYLGCNTLWRQNRCNHRFYLAKIGHRSSSFFLCFVVSFYLSLSFVPLLYSSLNLLVGLCFFLIS
jgi:hypothetical protein